MRIGDLARKTGLSRDTIRFYERHGLLVSAPSASADNTYRDYPEDNLGRAEIIVLAREAGMAIADLERLVALMEGGDLTAFDADAFLGDQITAVEAALASGEKLLALLRATRTGLAQTPDVTS